MSVAKYVARIAGKNRQVNATQASTGPTDAGKIPGLDESGRLHGSLMPVGIVPEVTMVLASELLLPRKLVNFYNDAGVGKVRLADASNGREVDGYVLEETPMGEMATVYHEAAIPGFSGLIVGQDYYLADNSAGGITATPVSGEGKIDQYVGFASTPDKLVFEPGEPIYLVGDA